MDGGMDPNAEQLADVIRERCAGSWPLIYGGAELYGTIPGSSDGAEVQLGRGAIVLLDPPEMPGGQWAGTYDLLFYDENSGEPTLRVPVGPKLTLSPQSEAESHPGRFSCAPRASMARRMTMGPSLGAMSCFDFAVEGVGVTALTFDRDVEAQSFVRDLSVRLRLTRASLKASRGVHSVFDLKGQLLTMKRNSLAARMWRWTVGLVVFALAVMLFQACVLYFNDDRAITDVAAEVLGNAMATAEVLGGTARFMGAAVCHGFEGGRMLPAAAVDACAEMPHASDALACIQGLSARTHLG